MVSIETEMAIESRECGISSIIDHSEESSLGLVLEKRNADEDSKVQSGDMESASSTLQMSTEVQLDSESTLLESSENQDNMNLNDTDMSCKPNNSDLRAKQEKDCSDHQSNKFVEQTQVSSTDAQDTSKIYCTSESDVRLHLATAGIFLHQANSDAVMSDCNIVQGKSNSSVREYKDIIPVSRVKVSVAPAKNGFKVENKSHTNTSVPSKYQFQQSIGQRKDNVGSSNTISDKVFRNCRLISVASQKPVKNTRSKSTVPRPFFLGPERRTRNNASSFQNTSKDVARTWTGNIRESTNKRVSKQVQERILTRGPMRRAAKLREPQQEQKRKGTEIKRICLPINLSVPNHCKPYGGGEYRSTIALRKNELKKGPVTPVRDGVKLNQNGKTNGRQYQQILSMMKSKREKELQNLRSVGLVVQKRALFEEYYKRSRALKAMKEITRQYGGDDPMTSQSGLDETLVCIKSLSDEMSNVIVAHSGSELLESFPRTEGNEIHDSMAFDKEEISRKSDNSESDTKQGKNPLSCEVRIHHRQRLPRDNTLLIRAERHQLSGLVGSSKQNCKLKSKIGSDIATTGNVLHPANSHAVKPVRDNLLKKANSHVTKLKENIPVKEEETVASVRKRTTSIPVDLYKPLRDGLFQGTSSKAASLRKQGAEVKRGSEQGQESVSATSRMGRVANVSELLKARTLRPFNLRAIKQSNPHGGYGNRPTIALRKVELEGDR